MMGYGGGENVIWKGDEKIVDMRVFGLGGGLCVCSGGRVQEGV